MRTLGTRRGTSHQTARFRSPCRWSWLALSAAILLEGSASARPHELRTLGRALTVQETKYYQEPLAKTVGAVEMGLKARGWSCKPVRGFAADGSVKGPESGLVSKDGVIPSGLGVKLVCDMSPKDSCYLDLDVAVDAKSKAEHLSKGDLLVKRARSTLRRLHWSLDDPPVALVIDTAKPPATGPVLAIRFDCGTAAKDAALALDEDVLVQALQGLRPITKAPAFNGAEPPKPTATAQSQSATEREVLSSVVRHVFGDRPLLVVSEPEPISIKVSPATREELLASAPNLRPSLFREFERVLRAGGTTALPEKAKVIANAESDKLFEVNVREGWKEFKRRYPGAPGILTLSRVGFSFDMQQAIVYVGWQEDALVGQGTVYILEKSEEGWSILYSSILWMS